MTELRRYNANLGVGGALAAALKGEQEPESQPVSKAVDLGQLDAVIDQLPPETHGAALDKALVEHVRLALPLSRRQAADSRTWEWLCASRYPEIVWRRWHGTVPDPEDVDGLLTPAVRERFLCKSSLRGTARNSFARLWWAAETLGTEDPELLAQAVASQDCFVAVFERRFGAYPPAARACITAFAGRGEAEIRDSARWLSQVLTTTALEVLSEAEILGLLDQRLPPKET